MIPLVARSTRAWIETAGALVTAKSAAKSHALRVRGLKRGGSSLFRTGLRRTLYACVD